MHNNNNKRDPPNVSWEHFWSPAETQDALCDSVFRDIPPEIMIRIFQALSVSDLANVSLVCRAFKRVADQDDIWKAKCNISTKALSKTFKQIYMEWIYEKYLRNEELLLLREMYRRQYREAACAMWFPSVAYPVRPKGIRSTFTPVGGLTQHPNSSSEMTIELKVNVEKIAPELISLLEKASTHRDQWQKPAVLKQMITRYYRFMQLKSSCSKSILLVPTLDIEIVWQTHLLRPTMYRADCLRLFHRVIDHSLLTSNIEQYLKEQAFIDTCQLYEQRFGEPYCPLPLSERNKERAKYVVTEDSTLRCVVPVYSYWDETHFQFSTDAPASYENPFSFTEADLILDGHWLDLCERFMSEMLERVEVFSTATSIPDRSQPIDLRIPAIKRLKKSYERFLYLAAIYPPIEGYNFVHPTYAIDIIWHSHMQEPLKYVSDTTRLVGYIIDHAPWPWVEMSKLMNSCDKTNDNWKLEFDNELSTDHLYNIEGKDDMLWN